MGLLASILAQQSGPGPEGLVALIPCCIMLGAVVIGIAGFVFWIWALIDCATREFPGENDKLVWILIIVFAQLIGAIIYLLVGRPKGVRR